MKEERHDGPQTRRTRETRREREGDERRQDESERRSDELKEAWRRNHPSEPEGGEGRPKRWRPA